MNDPIDTEQRIAPDEEFWSQVAAKGALDPQLIQEYRDTLTGRRWLPLGAILIKQKHLSVREIMTLLDIQASEPDMRIGDLAVREGFCTPEQISECLAIQAETCPGPIELMLRDTRLDEANVMEAVVGYIHFLEGCLFSLRSELAAGTENTATE